MEVEFIFIKAIQTVQVMLAGGVDFGTATGTAISAADQTQEAAAARTALRLQLRREGGGVIQLTDNMEPEPLFKRARFRNSIQATEH